MSVCKDSRILKCGLDKAIEMIERRKAIFAAFCPRTGVKSTLGLLAIRNTFFNKEVMRLPLRLATGIKESPQIAEEEVDESAIFSPR